MNILVTGGLGFIGSNYINYIFHNDKKINKIINLDKFSYCSSKKYINKDLYLSKKYKFYKKNISNKDYVFKVLNKYKINRVVNFAAYSHVDNSINDPNNFISSNINSFNNFIDTCFKYWNSNKNIDFKFVQISTDEVFGSLKNRKDYFNEKSHYNPSSPYSSSKASTDLILNSYAHTFNFPCITTYSCNNFGPNQYREKFIPTIINSCINKKSIPVYGNGKNIRQWIFVEDNVRYIHDLVVSKNNFDKYCIASKIEMTNIDLVKIICDNFSNSSSRKYNYRNLIKYVRDRKGHDNRYYMKSLHPIKKFKYSNFDENLIKTINFYIK